MAFMAKFIQYHSIQEYQLNLMPLQSINNNQQSIYIIHAVTSNTFTRMF